MQQHYDDYGYGRYAGNRDFDRDYGERTRQYDRRDSSQDLDDDYARHMASYGMHAPHDYDAYGGRGYDQARQYRLAGGQGEPRWRDAWNAPELDDLGARPWGRQAYGEQYGSQFGDDSQAGRGGYAGSLGQAQGHGGLHPPSYGAHPYEDAYGRALGGRSASGGYGSYAESGAMPSYRGRGPKNYTRSDERIQEDLCERLTHDERIDARSIEIQVRDGVVVLTGSVEQRWMKYAAEDIAEHIGGVKDIQNQLAVKPNTAQDDFGGSRYGGTTTSTSRASGAKRW